MILQIRNTEKHVVLYMYMQDLLLLILLFLGRNRISCHNQYVTIICICMCINVGGYPVVVISIKPAKGMLQTNNDAFSRYTLTIVL